jgi:hypothetical protein
MYLELQHNITVKSPAGVERIETPVRSTDWLAAWKKAKTAINNDNAPAQNRFCPGALHKSTDALV